MELLGIKYFCYAAEVESFSRTAEHFMVPTSNISQIIKRIEEEMETKLFDRNGNRVKLNENGKRFYKEVKEAIDKIEGAKRAALGDDAEEGELKLLILTNRRRIADKIESFGKKHPRITFSIAHKISGSITDYDFIISDTLPYLKGYEKQLFIRERMLLATKADSPLATAKQVTPDMLESEKFITMLEDSSLYKITDSIFRKLGISPIILIKCDDPGIIHRYVEIGLGVAIFPEVSWRDVFSDKIRAIEIGDFFRDSYIFAKFSSLSMKRAALFFEELKLGVDDN